MTTPATSPSVAPSPPPSATPAATAAADPVPAVIEIQHVYDKDDIDHYTFETDCARAIAGKLRVTGLIVPEEADVTGSVIYEDPAHPGEFLSQPADTVNNSPTDGSWECIWNNVTTGVLIRIEALPIYNGSDSCAFHIVPNYTVNPCAPAAPARAVEGLAAAGAAVVGGVAPYLEVLFAPAVVVAGEKFWALLRGEPAADPPNGALPIVAKAFPVAVTAGGSAEHVNGTTIFRTKKVALVEFTLPASWRRAELRFGSVFITDLNAESVLVDAIR